jgi:Cu-Zn family superoxide dismutase
VVKASGEGGIDITTKAITLGPGAASVLDKPTALVVHANPDDDKTDPAGNSGARIACGVITR